jgi:hypothetical protein
VNFDVEILRFVTLCSAVAGYQRYIGPCCVHLHGEMKGGVYNSVSFFTILSISLRAYIYIYLLSGYRKPLREIRNILMT